MAIKTDGHYSADNCPTVFQLLKASKVIFSMKSSLHFPCSPGELGGTGTDAPGSAQGSVLSLDPLRLNQEQKSL